MNGVNKADEIDLYVSGLSIPQVAEKTGIPRSTLRFRLKKAGVLRCRTEGVRLAAADGRIPSQKGVTRNFTPEWCANISKGLRLAANKTASGVSQKPNGYIEITRGENKGKMLHRVVMSEWLGRELLPTECVHHIDGDKTNNDINNLALMTLSGHARLHRREDELTGNIRERNKDGKWS